MARVKLEMPDKYIFACEMRVRVTDLNYGEHVGNDTILSYAHEARMQFLASYGFDEGNCMGPGLIMADAIVQYKAELFYGMTIKIYIQAGDFFSRGFDLFYLLVNKENNAELARIKTGMVFFDYKTRKTATAPAQLQEFWHNKPNLFHV